MHQTNTPAYIELDPEQTILGTRHTRINTMALRTGGNAKVGIYNGPAWFS